MEQINLYIHYPYCKTKCSFCDFNAYLMAAEQEKDYVRAVVREFSYWKEMLRNEDFLLASLYFGGGTPSLLSPAGLGEILNAAYVFGKRKEGAEITVEMTPDSVTFEKLQAYRKLGVNRVSIGGETFNDNLLQSLGRCHGGSDIRKAVEIAKECGFEQINVDLMVGFPGTAWEEVRTDLLSLLALDIPHLSVYELTVSPRHPLAKNKPKEVAEWLELAKIILQDGGFEHYEISNYARSQSFFSTHNLSYWTGAEVLGIGAGSHSYFFRLQKSIQSSAIFGARWVNRQLPKLYQEGLEAGKPPMEKVSSLTRDEALLEQVMTRLRLLTQGIVLGDLEAVIGPIDYEKTKENLIDSEKAGWVDFGQGVLKLGTDGIFLADEVAWRVALALKAASLSTERWERTRWSV